MSREKGTSLGGCGGKGKKAWLCKGLARALGESCSFLGMEGNCLAVCR